MTWSMLDGDSENASKPEYCDQTIRTDINTLETETLPELIQSADLGLSCLSEF
jgi:hypothetical protein